MMSIEEDIKNTVENTFTKLGSYFPGFGGGGSLDIVGQVVAGITNAVADSGILEKLFEALGEFAKKLIEAFKKGVEAADPKEISKAIDELIRAVLDLLDDKLDDLGNFPKAIGGSPVEVLKVVREVARLLDDLKQLENVEQRIEAVKESIAQLFAITSGGKAGDVILFGAIFDGLSEVILKLVQGADVADVLKSTVRNVAMPQDIVGKVLGALADGKLWNWATLPPGFKPGDLHKWINDDSTFPPGSGDAAAQRRFQTLQRQYRVRLVAVADRFLRENLLTNMNGANGKTPVAHHLTLSDGSVAMKLVADAVTLFLDTTILFVFEPECFPIDEFDWDGFEDVGFKLAALASRQLRVTIRGTIALILNGIWDFTVLNPVLIELVASLISVSISAFFEAVLRHLSWSLEIVTRYHEAPSGNRIELWKWPSLEFVENNSSAASDQLQYVALLRMPLPPGAPTPSLPDELKPIVQDFGAYIDVSYRQFKYESRFSARRTTDEVAISRAEMIGDRLVLWATTSSRFELPQPVLRAYVCCDVIAMRPGARPSDPYTIDLRIADRPRCLSVVVLSNRGGQAERRIMVY